MIISSSRGYESAMLRSVDVQCHIFPRNFVNELSAADSELKVAPPDSNGRRLIIDAKTHDEVTYFIENSPYTDYEKHLTDMDAFNIETQLLSLPSPAVDKIVDVKRAHSLSVLINDELAKIIHAEPKRFQGLATIAMNDPNLAVEEIERSVGTLGFKGVTISSNTNGSFYDSPKYEQVFEALERYDAPVFMHPTEPVTSKSIGQDYKLVLIFGWPFDTTLSISRLVFSGMLRKFPKLKLIAAHGGGMIPFFKGRIAALAKVAAGGGKRIVEDSPDETFKRLYYDAAFFDPVSLELLVKFAGADHVLYASDYPFGQDMGKNCYRESTDEEPFCTFIMMLCIALSSLEASLSQS